MCVPIYDCVTWPHYFYLNLSHLFVLQKSAGELNTANQKKRDLHQQCNNLKEQNRMLSERLEGCQKENEDGKTEIDNLKRSLQQLQRVYVSLACIIIDFYRFGGWAVTSLLWV